MAVEQLNAEQGARPLSQFRCAGCGYGASCRIAPERCPMCGGSTWNFELWRPFTGLGAHRRDADQPLTADPGI